MGGCPATPRGRRWPRRGRRPVRAPPAGRGSRGQPRAAYLAVNPMGKIPALVDGKLRLWESNAINWYVAEKLPQSRLLPPSIEGRASVQRWLFFQAAHVTPACIPVFPRHEPARAGVLEDEGRSAGRRGRPQELARYLPVDRGRSGGGRLARRRVLSRGHCLRPAPGADRRRRVRLRALPRVRAWLARLQSRPAWRRVAEMILVS